MKHEKTEENGELQKMKLMTCDKVSSVGISNHSIKDISKAKFYPGKMQGNRIDRLKPAPTISRTSWEYWSAL